MQIQIPLIGQGYTHRSLDLSAQSCKGYYPEFNKEVDAIISLQPFPGVSEFSVAGSGDDGGMHVFREVLYKVTGRNLYRVERSGAVVLVGPIAGVGPCSFCSSEHEMVIVRAGSVHSYDGETLTRALDSSFELPHFVAYINNQAVYSGIKGRFCVSDPGKLTSISPSNYATAESAGDTIVAVYAHNQLLYLFGSSTIETWYNSGVGSPPFDRVQSGMFHRGTIAGHSISNNPEFIYFLGDDSIVYRLVGSQIHAVSTIPLTQELRTYDNVRSAIGQCFSMDGQQFYYLNIPGKKTWCYCETSGGWFELTRGVSELPYGASSIVDAYGKHMVGFGSTIGYLDHATNQVLGDYFIRERTSQVVHAGTIAKQYEGREITISDVEIVIKIVGAVGLTPTIMFGWSNDGRIFHERHLSAAPLGKYTWRVRTGALGTQYEWSFRVRVSDPVVSSIHSCNARVEVGI